MASQSARQHAGPIARLYLAMLRFFGLSSRWIRADGYQPEKHYMRGAGPKSRARDSQLS